MGRMGVGDWFREFRVLPGPMTPLEEVDAILPSGTDESPYPVFARTILHLRGEETAARW